MCVYVRARASVIRSVSLQVELLIGSFALYAMRGVERRLGSARFLVFATFNAAFGVLATLFCFVVGASVAPTLAALPPLRPGPLAFVAGVAAAYVAEIKPLFRVERGPPALREHLTDKLFVYFLLVELGVVVAAQSSAVSLAISGAVPRRAPSVEPRERRPPAAGAVFSGVGSFFAYRSKATRLSELRFAAALR